MKDERSEEELEMLKREAHRAREPRIQDKERIQELEAEVERLRGALHRMRGDVQLIDDRMQPADWGSDTTQVAWKGLKSQIQDALDRAEDSQDE